MSEQIGANSKSNPKAKIFQTEEIGIQQIKAGGRDFWLCQKKCKDDLLAPQGSVIYVFVGEGQRSVQGNDEDSQRSAC